MESCCAATEEFFRFLAENKTPFALVSVVDVDRAVAAKSARAELSRRTIQNHAVRLRMFFRFAEDRPPHPTPCGMRRPSIFSTRAWR